MAYSKEAVAIILDVGQHMRLPANDKNDSFLDLACENINWIISRKIFTESKDEIALILFGCEETNNPEAQDDQYQNISIVRELQLPDFDFIRYIQNEIKPTNIEADWLDAVVVAMGALREGTEGKKFGLQSISLFSNLGGNFTEDNIEQIAGAIKDSDIELNIIGPNIRSSESGGNESDSQNSSGGAGPSGSNLGSGSLNNSFSKRTDTMKRGEKTARRIFDCGVVGETYSMSEAFATLSHFQRRNVRPTPGKFQLEIGDKTSIPVCLYLRTKGFNDQMCNVLIKIF